MQPAETRSGVGANVLESQGLQDVHHEVGAGAIRGQYFGGGRNRLVSLASAVAEGTATLRRVSGVCAFAGDCVTKAAAPAAAPFKKPRRPEGPLGFDIRPTS